MLDYEWGNPSTIMLSGNEEHEPANHEDSDQTHSQLFQHYASQSNAIFPDHNFLSHNQLSSNTDMSNNFSYHHPHRYHHLNQQAHNTLQHSLFDPRAFTCASSASYPPPSLPQNPQPHNSFLSVDPLLVVPKAEDFTANNSNTRLGLNLGGRTYFSTDDDFVNRLYRRSTGSSSLSNSPKCQAEGCIADLSNAKHYHKRHKVCEFHSKAATVIAAGLTQRFCQQCSRYLSEMSKLPFNFISSGSGSNFAVSYKGQLRPSARTAKYSKCNNGCSCGVFPRMVARRQWILVERRKCPCGVCPVVSMIDLIRTCGNPEGIVSKFDITFSLLSVYVQLCFASFGTDSTEDALSHLFHVLSEFDNGKRSCRKRLADHNRRRRKNQQLSQENQQTQEENAQDSASNNFSRSPSDSAGAYSSSSVTVAVSPPDYFQQRAYRNTSYSTRTTSPFFSSGVAQNDSNRSS